MLDLKKKILFAIHYLELGGAEKSLLGLLDSLDFNQVEVDLFVYSHRGELMAAIPPQVQLLPEIPQYAQIERPLRSVLTSGYWRIAWARWRALRQYAAYARKRRPKDGTAVFSYISRNVVTVLPDIHLEKEYDLAVSYLMPHDYVLNKVRARRKAAWIHTDYSQVDIDAALELPVWSGYDRIVSISPEVTRHFLAVFPSLSERIVLIPNRVPCAWIRQQAEALSQEDVGKEMPKVPGRVNLLSVGRFSYAKNYDNVPDICRRLREGGLDAHWYLIGFGGDEAMIRTRIVESGMEGFVHILGKKENPYPYMAACDIYIQPSRYEGSPMTVLEAKSLGKPVALTDFPTARSVVEDGVDGIIVPLDNAACAEGIADLANNESLRQRISANAYPEIEEMKDDPLYSLYHL